MIRKVITGLATGTMLSFGLGAAVASAAPAPVKPASSFGCVNGDGGYCGSQNFALIGAGDLVMSVKPGVKIVGGGHTPVVVEPRSDSPLQDFEMKNYTGVGNSKSFEYAPNGHASGLCIADHTGIAGGVLYLNACNFGVGQTFTPTMDPLDSSVYSWTSGRSSVNVIADPGNGKPGTQLRMEIYGNYDSQELEFTSST